MYIASKGLLDVYINTLLFLSGYSNKFLITNNYVVLIVRVDVVRYICI